MGKRIKTSDFLFYAYEALLLVYSGWRVFDFMSNQLPKGKGYEITNTVLSVAFLGATEIGLLIWHFMGRKSANTGMQNDIAQVMTWIDFAGSFAAGIGDMVLHQTILDGYILPPLVGYILLYGLPVIFAANVGAGIIYKNNDANEMLEKKQKEIDFAKVDLELEIRDQTIKDLKNQKTAIANQIKSDAAKVLKREITKKIAEEYKLDAKKYDETPAETHSDKDNSFINKGAEQQLKELYERIVKGQPSSNGAGEAVKTSSNGTGANPTKPPSQ